ncbi:MAG: flagellar biosynthesis anti-sigma factor FlgM [Armatimonadota bacterium]
MRIDTTGLYPSSKTSGTVAEPPSRAAANSTAESRADNVTVSSRARLLALGKSALGGAPEIRASVVEAAREKLGDGLDVYDGAEIARAMIDSVVETGASSRDAG